MKACKWCGSMSETVNYKGEHICEKCKQSAEASTCRKCGNLFPSDMMMKGLCLNCLQLEEMKKCKQREDAMTDMIGEAYYPFEFTEKDFDEFMTWRVTENSLSPKDFKNSPLCRRLWMMVKLAANGVTDDSIINDNLDDLEELIETHMASLIGNKCRIYIISNMSDRKKLAGQDCIAHKGKVYIMKA